MMLCIVVICYMVGTSLSQQAVPRQMTIAAIFDQGGDRTHELAFRHAVRGINRNRDLLPGVELKAEIEHIQPKDSYGAEMKTCYLLEKGVVAIFGPLSKSSSEHIRSITDSMEIPYIETRWNYRSQNVIGSPSGYALNLHPDITSLGRAYLDLLEAYKWKTITILYQDNDSMTTLEKILLKTSTVEDTDEFRIIMKKLDHNDNGYRDVLREIFQSESKLIVLDCEKKILEEVLKQCQQVGLVSQGYSFFLTSLDAHTVNLDDFKYGGTNFTAFRMIDVDKPEVQNVIYSIVETLVDQDMTDMKIPTGNLDTTTALIYDSVTAFAIALHDLTSVQQVHQRPLDCSGQMAWAHGNSLVNYMKMVEFVGLSGPIKFDTSGLRTQFTLDLMELQMDGMVNIGSWNSLDHLGLARVEDTIDASGVIHPMANKTFVICTVLSPPYTLRVESSEKKIGNDRYEGFGIDLAAALAEILHCKFVFKLVDDGSYGGQDDNGNWNGMLGEVMEGKADLVIADISITAARAAAFEFSIPWFNLGISILYVKPRSAAPSLLAFLDPFTTEVYIYTILVFVVVTLVIYVLARFSPNQWEEPSNCTKEPEQFENCYTFKNSFWFTMGVLMQQGSDLTPIAVCVRFAASMWFFFALIMVASYTANLAAFLTVETLERPIESAENLANQNEIWYGAFKGGSTSKFFEKSTNDVYQRIHQFMDGIHKQDVMVLSNTAGVEKVEEMNGKYAFFMESAAIEFLVERRCKLSQVGGLLDNKGYGIASRKGTPYKPLLDNAILRLLEGGTLHKLKVKWWKQKRGGGACDAKGGAGGVAPLGLANVMGVFLVTMVGCAVATVFAILEFLYGTRQSAKEAGISWTEEMSTQLKFILQCHGNTKQLRSHDSDSQKSENSHSSRLSVEESPAYSRRKSNLSTGEKVGMKNNLTVEPPPYGSAGGSVSSMASHQEEEEEEVHENNGGNPFEPVENE